jgi:hypothetical protein
MAHNSREAWKTRLGLVFAMAGNAVGLGNYLRFPLGVRPRGVLQRPGVPRRVVVLQRPHDDG